MAGFEAAYEVSDLGRVRSLARIARRRTGDFPVPARVLTGEIEAKSGYRRYKLQWKGERRVVRVHVLVLETFTGPRPSPEHEGCHGDGDPSNNRLSNLRWDTSEANKRDMVRHGNHHATKRTRCPQRHQLAAPNLVNDGRGRSCLACARARAHIQHAVRKGLPKPDYQVVSDEYYAKIMAAQPGT